MASHLASASVPPSLAPRFLSHAAWLSLFVLVACPSTDEGTPEKDPPPPENTAPAQPEARPVAEVDSRPPPMHEPVNKWAQGAVAQTVDAADAANEGHILIDLGEEWTPYIFTERDTPDAEHFEHGYRPTYLALAQGEFPDDHHGARARRDKYLELYGILPTLKVLRERMKVTAGRECIAALDLEPLKTFDGFVAYRNNQQARKKIRKFLTLERQVERWVAEQEVANAQALDKSELSSREQRNLAEYLDGVARVNAIRATQDRLECEGFFEGKPDYTRGALDWVTHEALAEFERRNRVYGWGYIGRGTLDALRRVPMDNEHESVVRVLSERAMQSAGVIEDGSAPKQRGEDPTFRGEDGEQPPVPNLEAKIREQVVEAFGLQTPESTLAFLEGLEEIPAHRVVAIEGVPLPEYYSSNMHLEVRIDRGDVWYEFPYDEEGREQRQPVQRRPRLSVITRHAGEEIVLARFGSTIGGWRSESVEGNVMWKYKNSPTGPRLWHQIVSAPVWMPPEGTPDRSLLARNPNGRGRNAFKVNYHEMGPSYASAYGLVAAYHRLYRENEDGTITLRGDEGIRTHGSVDYMSIMRRHSHGCHRLHNHLAVRLMSFVLAHRAHTRVGQQRIGFGRTLTHNGHNYPFNLERGGYVFDLEEPIKVTVLPGRIRGAVSRPIESPLPRYDSEAEAYVDPEGAIVSVDKYGTVTVLQPPPPDGGWPDGGPDAGLGDGGLPADAGVSAAPIKVPEATTDAPKLPEGTTTPSMLEATP